MSCEVLVFVQFTSWGHLFKSDIAHVVLLNLKVPSVEREISNSQQIISKDGKPLKRNKRYRPLVISSG